MDGNHHDAGRAGVVRLGNVLFGADREIAQWVGRRISGYAQSDGARSIGVLHNDRIVAGVVFERFNGVNVEVSIAADDTRWASRSVLFRLFYYPFVTLGAECITCLVPLTNLKSLNLATKLGFNQVAIIPFAAHGGNHLVVLQAYREQCRWLNYGQGKQRGSESA